MIGRDYVGRVSTWEGYGQSFAVYHRFLQAFQGLVS